MAAVVLRVALCYAALQPAALLVALAAHCCTVAGHCMLVHCAAHICALPPSRSAGCGTLVVIGGATITYTGMSFPWNAVAAPSTATVTWWVAALRLPCNSHLGYIKRVLMLTWPLS